jgi:hypothetical protein
LYPFPASCRANSRPIPPVAPVMSAQVGAERCLNDLIYPSGRPVMWTHVVAGNDGQLEEEADERVEIAKEEEGAYGG